MTRSCSIALSVTVGIVAVGGGNAVLGTPSTLDACATRTVNSAVTSSALFVFFPDNHFSPFGMHHSSMASARSTARCRS